MAEARPHRGRRYRTEEENFCIDFSQLVELRRSATTNQQNRLRRQEEAWAQGAQDEVRSHSKASAQKKNRNHRSDTASRSCRHLAVELLRPNLGKFSCSEHRSDDQRESARPVGGRAIAKARVVPSPEFCHLAIRLFVQGSFFAKTLRVGTRAGLEVTFPNRERIGP